MTGGEDSFADVEVDVLDDTGVRDVIDNAIAQAECTSEELHAQAETGTFSSETALRAWFAVSTFESSPI